MNRIVSKSLQSVAIGPYNMNSSQMPVIEGEDTTGLRGGLSDIRLGVLDGGEGDKASHFGVMGAIPLNQRMLNPIFEPVMLEYLNIFDLIQGRLRVKANIRDAIDATSNLTGYRKMKEISTMFGGTKWKVDTSGAITAGGEAVKHEDLYDYLVDSTRRYTSGNEVIHLSEIGINVDVAKPEDFVINHIPVLPATMRRPSIMGKAHALTDIYKMIISAARSGNLAVIRSTYLRLVNSGEEGNLRDDVFSNKKNGFVRGSMLSKTGGQIARSVAGASIHLKPYEIGVPKRFALDLSQRVMVTHENMADIQALIAQGEITHILDRRTGQYIALRNAVNVNLIPNRMLVLRQLQDGDAVIANRQPTLHRNGMLAFKVVMNEDEEDNVIYTHPSVSTGFGLDYDGDEMNIIVPYSELGKREANELMFMPYHMASMASSNLLVGYHQDVNLGAHMLTMEGTMVRETLWHSVARISHDLLWRDKYPSYDEWVDMFRTRCNEADVDMYHGRSLYSTLLPEDLNWVSDDAMIRDGILISGLLNKSNASGTPGSIGMLLYRVYGSDVCVQWLNASYLAMNEFLVNTGVTMGIDDIVLEPDLQDRVNTSISTYLDIHQETFNADTTNMRPEAKARYDASVLQDLNNIRERVAKMIIEDLTGIHKLRVSSIDLWKANTPMTLDHVIPGSEEVDGVYQLRYDTPVPVELHMYEGYMLLDGQRISMGVYDRVRLDETIYTREAPSPLLLMTKSGARGNETNIIQISGIIGQQSFANDRIPLMMAGGTRSMPCFDFDENTPESRGHISSSYREGMTPSAYVAAHVASRENLTSNTDLTPKTGYFGRRLRVFMENLSVKRKNGRQFIGNERDVAVMWDFSLDPSMLFSIGGRRTFIDVAYELSKIRTRRSRTGIVINIPSRRRLDDYIRVSKNVDAIRALYPTTDIILSMHPGVEARHPSFYDYMKERFTTITRTGQYDYLQYTEYDRLLVLPASARLPAVIDMDTLPDGFHINVSQAGIEGISYPSRQGEPIPSRTLYDMVIMGTEFTRYPMVMNTGIDAEDDISLLTAMINEGSIFAL